MTTTTTATSYTGTLVANVADTVRFTAAWGAVQITNQGVDTIYYRCDAGTATVAGVGSNALLAGQTTFIVGLMDGGGSNSLTRVTLISTGTPTYTVAGVNLPAANDAAALAALLGGAYVPLAGGGGFYHAAVYSSIQAAINACHAGGGGVVRVAPGTYTVSTTLQMKSKVILSGADAEWSLWGYNSATNVLLYQHTILNADSSTGPVIEFGDIAPPEYCVDAGVRNMLIKANGRTAVQFTTPTTIATRSGNTLRDVYCWQGGVDIQTNAQEVRLYDCLIVSAPGDGLTVSAQDCTIRHLLVGFCTGNGVTLNSGAGPTRINRLETFSNGGTGITINGDDHPIFDVTAQGNGKEGIKFAEATNTVIIGVRVMDNSASSPGTYANVEFAGTTGNTGCAIIGGHIYTTVANQQSAHVHTSEGVFTRPVLANIIYGGSAGGTNDIFHWISPLSNFKVYGGNVPFLLRPEAGVGGLMTYANGTSNRIENYNTGGSVVSGIGSGGQFFHPVASQTLSVDGAVTIDASAGDLQIITLSANATSSSITNGKTGQLLTIDWLQDGTGGRTYAWPTNCYFGALGTPTAQTGASLRDSVTFRYDGTNWHAVAQTALPGTGKITSAMILDGTIMNADINASAAIAYSKLNLASSIVSGDIVNNTVANGDLAQMAAYTVKGNAGSSTANAADLTVAQLAALVARSTFGYPIRNVRSGSYTFPGGNVTTNTPATDTAIAIPFIPHASVTLTKLAIQVTSFIANGKCRVGILNDDGTGYPGSVLLDAGQIDTSGSNGLKTVTISQAVTAGTLYWLVAVNQTAAAQLQAVNAPDWGVPSATGGSTTNCAYYRTGETGALTTWVGSTLAEASLPTRIGVYV